MLALSNSLGIEPPHAELRTLAKASGLFVSETPASGREGAFDPSRTNTLQFGVPLTDEAQDPLRRTILPIENDSSLAHLQRVGMEKAGGRREGLGQGPSKANPEAAWCTMRMGQEKLKRIRDHTRHIFTKGRKLDLRAARMEEGGRVLKADTQAAYLRKILDVESMPAGGLGYPGSITFPMPTPRDRLTTAEFVGGAPVAPRESPASHFRDRYMNIMRR